MDRNIFFKLLRALRTPRRMPPVGPVPVSTGAGGTLRDSYGRPVMSTGRGYDQPPVRGVNLMERPGLAAAAHASGRDYTNAPAVTRPFDVPPDIYGSHVAAPGSALTQDGQGVVVPFRPQAVPEGVPLYDGPGGQGHVFLQGRPDPGMGSEDVMPPAGVGVGQAQAAFAGDPMGPPVGEPVMQYGPGLLSEEDELERELLRRSREQQEMLLDMIASGRISPARG